MRKEAKYKGKLPDSKGHRPRAGVSGKGQDTQDLPAPPCSLWTRGQTEQCVHLSRTRHLNSPQPTGTACPGSSHTLAHLDKPLGGSSVPVLCHRRVPISHLPTCFWGRGPLKVVPTRLPALIDSISASSEHRTAAGGGSSDPSPLPSWGPAALVQSFWLRSTSTHIQVAPAGVGRNLPKASLPTPSFSRECERVPKR